MSCGAQAGCAIPSPHEGGLRHRPYDVSYYSVVLVISHPGAT